MRLALGSLDTFASRPSWVADSRVSPNSTAAAAYCHRSVGLGFATIDGIIWKATLQEEVTIELQVTVTAKVTAHHCVCTSVQHNASLNQWRGSKQQTQGEQPATFMHQTGTKRGDNVWCMNAAGCSPFVCCLLPLR